MSKGNGAATGGGAATQAGMNYQNRVAAWMCVHILAEQEVGPMWGLPQNVTVEFIRCETEQPVDDILIGTSGGGHSFIQVKHSLTASKSENAALASSLDQFVRQFLAYGGGASGKHPWERPLDPALDRLVLITTSKTSAAVKEHLPSVLTRLRASGKIHPIEDAATNAEERHILTIVRNHLERFWLKYTGTAHTEADERQLLSLIWVQILDVDDNGRDEREAKNILRTTVVKTPVEADVAWNTLVLACAGYAAARSGADRNLLQRHLLDQNISIKAPRSYQADIERLREYSSLTHQALADLSTIRVGDRTVKIDRPASTALRTAAEQNSVVVVGDPGSGKSGVLYDLVGVLLGEGADVVFLAVDRLEARSLGALRQEFGLEHEIVDVLRNWPGDKPAYLVVDALDAARSEASALTFYDLLAMALQNSGRWRVIASIRKFDLRHNTKLHRLFEGRPPTEFRSAEFYDLCHLNVPRLDTEEWLQISTQSPELAGLFVYTNQGLRELLLTPFNVRLAGELIGAGSSIESLTPIETQIGLLDRYWEERVVRSDYESDAREEVLTRAAEAMVKTRSLRANRRDVAGDATLGRALNDVLSAHILSEWEPSHGKPDRSVVTFAHHMIFDYATSCLLLRGTEQRFVERLEKEPDLVMAIRPSIVMHFEYCLFRGEEFFWDAVFRVIRSQTVPEIGKLIGPTVAADSIREISGFSPLVRELASSDLRTREVAEKALRHVMGALLVADSNSSPSLTGPTALLWSELLDQCTALLRAPIAYSTRPVLLALCQVQGAVGQDARVFLGRVARRLLEFALAQETRDILLITGGLQAVCQTFESDPIASAALLRRCLEPSHVLQYGHEELFHLGREVEGLIPIAPELVEDIFRAAFTLYDPSQEKTWVGGSRIVGLTSTRRQDFDLARFVLTSKYRQFIGHAPVNATRILIAILDAYVAERHYPRSDENQNVEAFDFSGRAARIRADHSAMWISRGTYRNDKPIQMLDILTNYLEEISSTQDRNEERQQILDVITKENSTAVLWRQLLLSGAKFPETLGMDIRSLAWALPILDCDDTTWSAGDLLKAIFIHLTCEERKRVERAIISIPEEVEPDDLREAQYKRNRLLGCLDQEAIVTEEARDFVDRLRVQNEVPQNRHPYGPMDVSSRAYTDEDYLRDQGVQVDDPLNRSILTLTEPAKEFAAKHLNTDPTRLEIEEAIPALRALHDALRMAEIDGVHQNQRDLSWGYLAEACEAVAKFDEFSCDEKDWSFIKAVLLSASTYPQPEHYPESDEAFNRHQSWGSPAARLDAAQGVMYLARHASCVDSELFEAVERLACDSVPSVRFQVAVRLVSLYHTAPELMWKLLERISLEEESLGVLHGLLWGSLDRLAGYHPNRVMNYTRNIHERVCNRDEAAEVRKRCASIFAGLYLWQDPPESAEIVSRFTENPTRYIEEVNQVVFDLRNLLNLGPIDPPNQKQDAVRTGAFRLIEHILTATRDDARIIETNNSSLVFNLWSNDDQEKARGLAHLAESVCMQIYFASGAYKDAPADEENKVPLGSAERLRFLREARGSLELLSEFAHPNLTHYLLQTLEYLISFDPEEVFLLVGRVVRKGRQGGYEYESLAVDLMVRLIERFIAEFGHLLQENEQCRHTLIEILDTFVDAGWASARRLTYRMEEIFR
jgi:hypothetical protein